MERPQVFYTYEWALAVYRSYRENLHPLLFLAYGENGDLRGIAALATDVDGQRVTFLCASTGDYCDFISLPEQRPSFVAAVFEELKIQGVRDLALANFPSDSASATGIIDAAKQQGFSYFARTAYICAQVTFSRLERTEDGTPTAPGRKRVRRFVKAMAREGAVTFDHNRSWDEVAPILPKFTQAHVARFLEIGRISNLASSHRRSFLTELARLLSDTDWLVLSRMLVAERAVAWHYGFQFHDTWFWYQPTFDSRVEKYWPGFCLLTQVIHDATKIPELTNLDLGLGSEAYKSKFANDSRETLYITLHRSILKHLGTMIRYRVAVMVKARPRLEKIVNSVRKRLSFFRDGLRGSKKQRLARAWKRLSGIVWMREEVSFREWTGGSSARATDSKNVQLRSLDLSVLAVAAMEHAEDNATLGYLLRATQRMRQGGPEGFVLVCENGFPLYFAWVAPLNGFYCAELKCTLQAPEDCMLLFDYWTPSAVGDRRHHTQAIELIAEKIAARGKRPWVLSAAGDELSNRSLEKSGFQDRYSLVRRRLLGRQWISGSPIHSTVAQSAEVAGHV